MILILKVHRTHLDAVEAMKREVERGFSASYASMTTRGSQQVVYHRVVAGPGDLYRVQGIEVHEASVWPGAPAEVLSYCLSRARLRH